MQAAKADYKSRNSGVIDLPLEFDTPYDDEPDYFDSDAEEEEETGYSSPQPAQRMKAAKYELRSTSNTAPQYPWPRT